MPVSSSSSQTMSLASAIAIAEGYNVSGSIPNTSNNPGDLKNGDVGYGTTSNGITIYGTPDQGTAALNNQAAHILNGDSNAYNYDPDSTTIADVGQIYSGGDPNWANNVANALGVTPDTTLGSIASGATPVNSAGSILPANKLAMTGNVPGQQTGATASTQGTTNPNGTILGDNPTVATPVAGQDITDADYAALYQADLEISTGMSEIPWYSDPNLITGNPRIRQSVQPVTFEVALSQVTGQMLKNPNTGETTSLQLNCSMREFNLSSKHVTNRTPTRTGMHVTFWGMAPDLITGSGSTGVFMNAYGLTDYYSIATPNQDILSSIQAAFLTQQGKLKQSSIGDATLATTNAEALRVAAQDAFTEFLKLFQMNGVVWYQPNPVRSDGVIDGTQQYSPTAWIPSQGTTSFQKNARANDVLSKGYVLMKYRNNTYLGYFKSLTWTMDAEKPFSWNFNFTFQVERTITALYYPYTGAM